MVFLKQMLSQNVAFQKDRLVGGGGTITRKDLTTMHSFGLLRNSSLEKHLLVLFLAPSHMFSRSFPEDSRCLAYVYLCAL